MHLTLVSLRSSVSSTMWVRRQNRDIYVKRAKNEQYRARSAYKLLEIDDKLKLLKPNEPLVVVECGSFPGAWTQVLTQRLCNTNSLIVACDLKPMQGLSRAHFVQGDFTSKATQDELERLLGGRSVDLVLSDMAPSTSGIASLDHEASIELVYEALKFSLTHQAPNGAFLAKLFDGEGTKTLLSDLQNFYKESKVVKPRSSRDESPELYVLARDFQGCTVVHSKSGQ